MNDPPGTVYIVDDDEAVRTSLSWLVDSAGLPALTFASATEFLDAWDGASHGCLVLDVRMPGMSGLELQQRLHEAGSHLPVVIVTGHADVPMAIRALKAGVRDFIEKPYDDEELLERIHDAMAHAAADQEAQARQQDLSRRFETLTAREREVLDCVVAGLSNKQIADQLGLSIKTVEVHRSRVMNKMAAHSLAELVRLAMAL
ncbi:MAG: sigma-70 family RNA polymerase sigma factor [Gammaproteobacteria bacterium]|jgi:RNA polymerase sigma factor (sigma-70 family)|nr:sigma-70 family RNA polymerase sigma factor [Gammaproteobacteria bacterium]